MTVAYSITHQNNDVTDIVTQAGATARLILYSGSAPASANAAATGTLLVAAPCANPIGTVSNGVLTFGAITGVAATGSGTAGYWRLCTDATGATCVAQGTVGVSGADLNFPAGLTINAGTIINLSGLVIETHEAGTAVAANLLVYSGLTGLLDQTKWPTGAGGSDYTYGGTDNYQDTTHVQPGHAYSLALTCNNVFNVGWQQGSNWGQVPPVGVDTSAFTKFQFDIWPINAAGISYGAHYTRATGDDIACSASLDNINGLPGVSLVANQWNTVSVPLSCGGMLSAYNYYKASVQQNCTTGQQFWLDNIQFVVGNTSWIYRGEGVPATGWADATPAGASADYTYLPNTATNPTTGISSALYAINNPPKPAAQFTGSVASSTLTVSAVISGTIAVGQSVFYNNNAGPSDLLITSNLGGGQWGLSAAAPTSSINMASGPPQNTIPVIHLTTTVLGGMLKLTYSGGFPLASLDGGYLTFGARPSLSGYGYQVQFYDTSGATLGSAVTAASYTPDDHGIATDKFTVYNIPLSAFGSLGASIGGISIKDTSSNSANSILFSALGFFT